MDGLEETGRVIASERVVSHMSEHMDDDDLPPLGVALEKYAVDEPVDWLSDGREEYRRLLEDEPEYGPLVREQFPELYWRLDSTPEPPEEVAEELGLES